MTDDRNPQQDEDTEGHVKLHATENDDVQGHVKANHGAADDDDVQGHRKEI